MAAEPGRAFATGKAVRVLAAAGAVCLALAGCALKKPPPYGDLIHQVMPESLPPPPALWTAPTSPSMAVSTVAGGWLRAFEAPGLEELVWEALRYNVDFQIAAIRLEEAAGYARLAGASLTPQVSISGRGSQGGGDSSGLAGVAAVASWELDIWGRVRYGSAAAEADYASAEADLRYARESLAAMVVKSWFLAIEAKLQHALAVEMIGASERLLSLANDRKRVGLGDDYEIAQAEASLATSRDSAQRLDAAFRQAVRALELLVGRYPAAELDVPSELARMPGPVPVGLPSELLERRPDVIAAERRVAAAFNRVGEANAARLPRIALTANVATVSSELFVLQNTDNPVWAVAGTLMAPIFDGGALRTQAEIRTIQQKEALARFAQVGARAFGEVETALTEEFSAEARAAHLARAIAENERALELAQIRYRIGSEDLRAVEQQRLALAAARSQHLRVEAERRVQRVNVHLALGGNFEHPEAAAVAYPATGAR
jgi:NodT family efflux transporter outer membrane factor (OMF) lipoprotein